MALADMQKSGSNAYVARLMEAGYGQSEIIARLFERFPEQPANSIYAAERRGREAHAAGVALSSFRGEGRVPAGAVPSGGTEGTGFRYYTTARLVDPQTGGEYLRALTIESASNLSFSQLAQRAQELVEEVYGPGGRVRAYQDYPAGLLATGLNVVAIERTAV